MTTVANPRTPGALRQPHTSNHAPNQTMAINPYPLTAAPPYGRQGASPAAGGAAAPDGGQVFELNGLAGDLNVYAVAPDGALTLTRTVDGLPAFHGSNGMERIAVS